MAKELTYDSYKEMIMNALNHEDNNAHCDIALTVEHFARDLLQYGKFRDVSERVFTLATTLYNELFQYGKDSAKVYMYATYTTMFVREKIKESERIAEDLEVSAQNIERKTKEIRYVVLNNVVQIMDKMKKEKIVPPLQIIELCNNQPLVVVGKMNAQYEVALRDYQLKQYAEYEKLIREIADFWYCLSEMKISVVFDHQLGKFDQSRKQKEQEKL